MILTLVCGVAVVVNLLFSAAIPASLTDKLYSIFFKGDSK
jgi:hypothetical protein